ncbi:biogenesis of lysosome-related organelles complex 1 subunit 5 [Rhinolophus sinicus]|uniref:biogenesis of lysosome-related organelles complex 1 subunit 5 n=1 Tax=Rhinolophus sinicus TaxID=89399 RepID=UPI003D78C9F3
MNGGGMETTVGGEATVGSSDKRRDVLGTMCSPAHLIIKGLGGIQSRLLHHRPVIQGETCYFVKELEEKHGKQLLTQSVDFKSRRRNGKRFIMTVY